MVSYSRKISLLDEERRLLCYKEKKDPLTSFLSGRKAKG
jgi:hypothetical protein